MSLPPHLTRVSRRHRCPVCDHTTWCVLEGDPADPDRVLCPRVESDRRAGDFGFVHALREDAPRRSYEPRQELPVDYGWWAGLAAEYARALSRDRLEAFADGLGVSAAALDELGIGWTGENWAFPMSDPAGCPIGIRLRAPGGYKFAVGGSRQGLFIPRSLGRPTELWIAEGPTDCAALLSVGLAAVGRPSCQGCEQSVLVLIRRLRPTRIRILADADGPGRDGALRLCGWIEHAARRVEVVVPPEPFGDAREAVNGGMTAEELRRRCPVLAATERGGAA